MRRRDLIATALAAGFRPTRARRDKNRRARAIHVPGLLFRPPADALLGHLTQQPSVITLAWHVDYWDHLGWRDRYASRAATARQQAYARQLDSVVFTPALVVNGGRVVVGSDQEAVEAAITTASALPVTIVTSQIDGGAAVDVGAAGGDVRALGVVYDPEHSTDVSAGENDGTRLREYRIVRAAETLAVWGGSARRLTLRSPDHGQGQAILVQATDDLRVLGAADLPPG